jgi:hypothetical protein
MRRKEIRDVIAKLHAITSQAKENGVSDIQDILSDLIEDLEYILNEEECYKDNIPENLQNGIRYEESEESCDNLEEAISALGYIDNDDSVEYILNSINEAIDYLHNAI